MCDLFSLPAPHTEENKWDLLLQHYRFPLDYAKLHAKSLQKLYKAEKNTVQNLTCSGAYLRSTLSSALLQKVLKLVPLTATGTEVYVSNTITVIYYPYTSLMETLNHMKSLKLKDHPGENGADCCEEILENSERIESDGAFKPKHLGYIIHIFEDTSDSRFHLWATQK